MPSEIKKEEMKFISFQSISIILALMGIAATGGYFCGDFFASQRAEIRELGMEIKHPPITITKNVYKDTCIEKPSKVIYKTKQSENGDVFKDIHESPIINKSPNSQINYERKLSESELIEILNNVKKTNSNLIELCTSNFTNHENMIVQIGNYLRTKGFEIVNTKCNFSNALAPRTGIQYYNLNVGELYPKSPIGTRIVVGEFD